MVLPVQQPSNKKFKPVESIDTKKDTLDHILTGLEMANAALGIAGGVGKLSNLAKASPPQIDPGFGSLQERTDYLESIAPMSDAIPTQSVNRAILEQQTSPMFGKRMRQRNLASSSPLNDYISRMS